MPLIVTQIEADIILAHSFEAECNRDRLLGCPDSGSRVVFPPCIMITLLELEGRTC